MGSDFVLNKEGLPLITGPTLEWNTFLGSPSNDYGYGVAADSSGNVYISGYSYAAWGSPIRSYSGGGDAFVAKLNSSGVLQWNTFLGSSSQYDGGSRSAVDSGGNVYITGYSWATWGSPIQPYSGSRDAFVAKLNSNGDLQWNTFLGSAGEDAGVGLAVDSSGNAYITGFTTGATWGSPILPFPGGTATFVAKLNSSGDLQWNTFWGNANEWGGVAVDTSGNVYITGYSSAAWGSPIRPYSGGIDAFVAKLNSNGDLQWNTFLGSSSNDQGIGVAVNASGNVYITGNSWASWGAPIWPYSGGDDAFLAKLNSSGDLQWNTFLGSYGGYDVAVDTSGNIYVAGSSPATWGAPIHPFSGGADAFVAKIKDHSVIPSSLEGIIKLPKTGQARCWNSSGSEISCAGTGQDGDIQAGAAWPNPRFSPGTGTEADCMVDNLTGLMWPKNANYFNGAKNWNDAIDSASNLTLCGHSDWRLPNINELESLTNADAPDNAAWLVTRGFTSVKPNFYWSSTTQALYTWCAWVIDMWDSAVTYDSNGKAATNYVWPVRGVSGGSSAPSAIWKTGQTTSYRAGDDGDLETGIASPDPRFTPGTGTEADCIIDKLTGLMWPKNANYFNGAKIWDDAIDSATNLTLCGHSDWRLPNKKELRSFIDYSYYIPALDAGHPFSNVMSNNYYWSSTTSAYDTTKVWYVNISGGASARDSLKNDPRYVWPVRGGQ